MKALLFIGLFTLTYSFPQGISDFILNDNYIYPSTSIQAGSFIELNSQENDIILMNQHQLYYSKERRKAIGIIGLYTNDIGIFSKWNPDRYVSKFLNSKLFLWDRQLVKVIKPPLKKIANLNIPKSIWKKVSINKDPRKSRDRRRMKKVLSSINQNLKFDYCFRAPLDSKIVSKFGSPRRLPSGYSYYHTGVDLRAYYGTPIPSMGKGKVVFADHMIVAGNTVVIDHGGGFFSRYMHLQEFQVKAGEWVDIGDSIGFSGATGRVEAPHLHWEVIWKGNRGNPHQFLHALEPLCDPV